MATPYLLRPQYAYRITLLRDWERAQTEGFVEQSPLDKKDGFYHFSTASQVPATLGRYFKGVGDIVLLQIRCDAFAHGVLRYDMAPHVKGNNVFPHVYLDRLPTAKVHAVVTIHIDADSGQHVLSLSPLPDRVAAGDAHEPARYAHVLVRVPSPANGAAWRLTHVRRALTQAVDACALDGAHLDVCVEHDGGSGMRGASVRSVCTLLHTLYECVSDLAVARADPLLNARVLLPGLGAEAAIERAAAADSRVHVMSVIGGDGDDDVNAAHTGASSGAATSSDDAVLHEYEHAVLGGTFDHLHAGHKIMLTVAAASASRSLVIGLSVDELLVKKKHSAFLESYDARVLALRAFLGALKPTLTVDVQPLRDIYGPSVERSELQALVVSEETRAGGAAVNTRRVENGMRACDVVVIPLVGAGDNCAGASKLSSSDIRQWLSERAALAALAAQLRPGFMRLMCECGVDGSDSGDGDEHSLAAQTWASVCARYTERHRAYHTLAHIGELLALGERYATHIRDRRVFELCVWFHDLVYSAPHERADLEEQSAADFWAFAHAAAVPLDTATRVGRIILATKRHLQSLAELDAHVAAVPLADDEAAAAADARLFLQLDLSIVGADADAYAAYAQAIRREYCRVQPAEFRAGRGAVLRKFRDAVDETSPLRLFDALGVDQGARLRARARENLESELATLSVK